jgi:hypothetical protein
MAEHYDDGGLSGASLERPALQTLLAEVRGRRIDTLVVHKVDRLTRSLADFAKLIELFDAHQVSFVSVTQSFNTSSSMGPLTLNVLLSFAQFERELISERACLKIAAPKRKGLWVGGPVPLGYSALARRSEVVPVGEHHAPFGNAAVRRDQHGAVLVRPADQLEEQVRRIGLQWQVAEPVDVQQHRLRQRHEFLVQAPLAVCLG